MDQTSEISEISEVWLTVKTIPNFSNRMVREFLEYSPYGSIQQFRKEIGKYVRQDQVAEWEKYVYVPILAPGLLAVIGAIAIMGTYAHPALGKPSNSI